MNEPDTHTITNRYGYVDIVVDDTDTVVKIHVNDGMEVTDFYASEHQVQQLHEALGRWLGTRA